MLTRFLPEHRRPDYLLEHRHYFFIWRSFDVTLDQAGRLFGNGPLPADVMKEKAKW
jgi:hypothetical protein